jgi:hypothetical protein
LEGKEFGELSVMVIDQVKRQTYLEFDWTAIKLFLTKKPC